MKTKTAPNKPTTKEIIGFLQDLSGMNKIEPTSDIFSDVGMRGDDFHEMIEKFTIKYSVDMTNYLWYFHTDEESGWNSIGGLFFTPPYKRVDRIPITPTMLTEFADTGKWNICYPDHKISTRRYDLLVNQVVIGLFLIIVLIISISKCAG